jgi:hypothetical protein
MIIPFFESNLNAGQFLFFPWMTFLFYYLHVQSGQWPIVLPVPQQGLGGRYGQALQNSEYKELSHGG